jgi:hypothetical protein
VANAVAEDRARRPMDVEVGTVPRCNLKQPRSSDHPAWRRELAEPSPRLVLPHRMRW